MTDTFQSDFNPAVTICDWLQGGVSRRDALAYIAAQTVGAFAGVAALPRLLVHRINIVCESGGHRNALDER